MAVVNLSNTPETLIDGNDGVVIIRNLASKPGGTTLDTTGFAPTTIKPGHVVIQDPATGNYKPMPVTGSAYAALPASHVYAGIVVASVPTAKPFVGIMIAGAWNPLAGPYTFSSIAAAFKTAVPTIVAQQD